MSLPLVASMLVWIISPLVLLQESGNRPPTSTPPPDPKRPTPEPKERPAQGGAVIDHGEVPAKPAERSRAELEEEFKNSLFGASLIGSWQMTGKGEEGAVGALTPPRTEKYVIGGAMKISEEVWIITARIQFADKDVNIPVPVRVVWAEDTPMITLSEFPVPMLGTYSCRVIFHHGYYSGIWYSKSKNYGGVMSGQIVKEMAPSPKAEGASPNDKDAGGAPKPRP